MTNELSGYLDTLGAAVKQMEQWPVAILIVVVLIVMGSALKIVGLFPNRLIPIAVLLMGAAANWLLGDPGAVSETQRHPMVVLALHGFLLGFAAWIIHRWGLKRFENRIPFLAGKSGDTTPPFKPE